MATPDFATRPEKPKNLLLFTSEKGLRARAVPASVQFSKTQIALDFEIVAVDGRPQRALIYAAPEGSGLREGELGEIPPGTTVRMYGSFSGNALEFTVDKLSNAGWKSEAARTGPGTPSRLVAGQADGLGSVECKITVDVEEYDNRDGKWYMREFPKDSGEFHFAPRMKVGFVNKLGGSAFGGKEATASDIASLDALLRGAGGNSTPAASNPQGGPPPSDEEIPF